MAATTHPSVFSPFCLRADQPSWLPESLEKQGITSSHLCPLQVSSDWPTLGPWLMRPFLILGVPESPFLGQSFGEGKHRGSVG